MKKLMICLALMTSFGFTFPASAESTEKTQVEQSNAADIATENDVKQEANECIVHAADGITTCR